MLAFNDMLRIQSEVINGTAAPDDEETEAAEFRKGIEADLENAEAEGIMLDFPDLREGPELLKQSAADRLIEAAGDPWANYP